MRDLHGPRVTHGSFGPPESTNGISIGSAVLQGSRV